MSKHIPLQKWLEYYELYTKKEYEQLAHRLWIETGRNWNKQCIQHWIKDKFHKYRKSNFDKNIFINKTGWAKKMGTQSGRPLKNKNFSENATKSKAKCHFQGDCLFFKEVYC